MLPAPPATFPTPAVPSPGWRLLRTAALSFIVLVLSVGVAMLLAGDIGYLTAWSAVPALAVACLAGENAQRDADLACELAWHEDLARTYDRFRVESAVTTGDLVRFELARYTPTHHEGEQDPDLQAFTRTVLRAAVVDPLADEHVRDTAAELTVRAEALEADAEHAWRERPGHDELLAADRAHAARRLAAQYPPAA